MPLNQVTIDSVNVILTNLNVQVALILKARDNVMAVLAVHEDFSLEAELLASIDNEKVDAKAAADALSVLLA